MSDDLIAWLRDQLDQDEATARSLFVATRITGAEPDFYGAGGPAADAYWAHFTPARALREVDSKRRLLDLHKQCGASCYVAKVLVLPYADRSGYRDKWRPR